MRATWLEPPARSAEEGGSPPPASSAAFRWHLQAQLGTKRRIRQASWLPTRQSVEVYPVIVAHFS